MSTSAFVKGIISRRDFIRAGLSSAAAAGIMAYTPHPQDGALGPLAAAFGTGIAYARDGILLGDDEYVIEVVGVDEIGVFVVDATNTDEKGDPVGVPGAIVILTSTDDPSLPQIQARTGDDGKCIMNINSFCKKDEQGNPDGGIFQASISVTITSDDQSICDYAIPSTLAIGATGYRFATVPYEGKPYLLSVAFNKQDILHELTDFLRSPYNQYEYEICVRIKGLEETTPVTLTFYRASDTERKSPLIGGPMTAEAELDDTGRYYEVIFSAYYLYAGNDEGLPADDITIVVDVLNSFTSELSMKVVDAPTDAFAYEGPLSILPCRPDTLFNFSLPLGDDKEKFGLFSKMDVSLVCPTTPVHFYVTPYLLIIGFTLDVKLAKWKLPSNTPAPAQPEAAVSAHSGDRLLDASASDANELLPWGYSPSSYQDTWLKSIDSDIAKLKNAITNHANPVLNNEKPPNACRYSRFGSINVDLILQTVQQYQWNGFKEGKYEDKTYSHTGAYSFTISAVGSYTWQMAAGPVPWFITVSLCLSVGLSYTNASTRETLKLSDGHTGIDTDHAIEIKNQALAINFGILFSVSAGFGIQHISVRLILQIADEAVCVPADIIHRHASRKSWGSRDLHSTLMTSGSLRYIFAPICRRCHTRKRRKGSWRFPQALTARSRGT